jgi:hypothetical protein
MHSIHKGLAFTMPGVRDGERPAASVLVQSSGSVRSADDLLDVLADVADLGEARSAANANSESRYLSFGWSRGWRSLASVVLRK